MMTLFPVQLVAGVFLSLAVGLSAEAMAGPTIEGDFVIAAMRKASDVASHPVDPGTKDLAIGQTVTFGPKLTWLDGKTCNDWSLEPSQEKAVNVDDPLLSDTQVTAARLNTDIPDYRLNRTMALNCNGRLLSYILEVDRRVLITRSSTGESYIILERPLDRATTEKLQRQLKDTKFYERDITGVLDAATRRSAAFFADYLGADYAFQSAAITENLLAALGVPVPADHKEAGDLELLKIVYYGPIAAHFMGHEIPLMPRSYGVEELWFSFKGDPGHYQFHPTGTLNFSDWYFDQIYSPHLSYILLLQDRFGPYHVVRAVRLKAYLLGKAPPDYIVGKTDDGPAAVHGNAQWISDNAFRYTRTCCGEPEIYVEYLSLPDRMGAVESANMLANRPAMQDRVALLPDLSKISLSSALGVFENLKHAARISPGQWTEGNVTEGADQKQYEPSDEELVAAAFGDGLAAHLAALPAEALKSQLQKAGLKTLEYTRFDFRKATVAGTGIFYFATAPYHVRVELTR